MQVSIIRALILSKIKKTGAWNKTKKFIISALIVFFFIIFQVSIFGIYGIFYDGKLINSYDILKIILHDYFFFYRYALLAVNKREIKINYLFIINTREYKISKEKIIKNIEFEFILGFIYTIRIYFYFLFNFKKNTKWNEKKRGKLLSQKTGNDIGFKRVLRSNSFGISSFLF